MENNLLENLQRELGRPVDAILRQSMPLNPQITPTTKYNALIFSVVTEAIKSNDVRDFITVAVFLHHCPQALHLVSMDKKLSELYARVMVLIYDDNHFPVEAEEAIINGGGSNLIHTLCAFGHKWSQKALAQIKAKVVLWMAYKRASSRKLSYYQSLRYMAKAKGSVLKAEVELMMPWSVPPLLVERGLASWHGDRFYLTPKGVVVATNV